MAGKMEAARTRRSPRRVSPAHHDRERGRRPRPPGRPDRPRASSDGVRRPSEWALAPPSQARRLRSPMAARRSGSRTTTKTQGCLFSALGAKVAACRTCSIRSSSSGSGRKARQARWRRTTSKKLGHRTAADRRRRHAAERGNVRHDRPVLHRRQDRPRHRGIAGHRPDDRRRLRRGRGQGLRVVAQRRGLRRAWRPSCRRSGCASRCRPTCRPKPGCRALAEEMGRREDGAATSWSTTPGTPGGRRSRSSATPPGTGSCRST